MAKRFDRPGLALIVDDEPLFCRALKRDFERYDWDVIVAVDRAQALEAVRSRRPTLAVVDLLLGQESGLDVADDLAIAAPALPVAVLTGHGNVALAVEAMQRGVQTFLVKPVDARAILEALRDAETKHRGRWRHMSLAHKEREHILRTLDECRGNKSEAAKRLGLARRSLQRKLSKNLPDE